MVIDDPNIESVALRKAKAHSPLLVDADAPLAFAITPKRLQAVRRRGPEILDPSHRGELREPHRGSGANLRGQASRAACRVEPLSLRISEGLNHSAEHKHCVYNCQAPPVEAARRVAVMRTAMPMFAALAEAPRLRLCVVLPVGLW
jgi:hypothetical protein